MLKLYAMRQRNQEQRPTFTPVQSLTMSTPRTIFCRKVAARPAEEVRSLLADACREGREVIATPIPKPASGAPFSFHLITRPPLPKTLPPRPVEELPAALAAERVAAAATRAAAVEEAAIAKIEPIVNVAAVSAAPKGEDPYDLRRWRRWSRGWDA